MYKYFNDYSGEWEEYECPEWWMTKPGNRYYRHQRVTQEMRRWYRDVDEEERVKLRKRRAPHRMDIWGDLEKIPSRTMMKSWKELSKKRKQWE